MNVRDLLTEHVGKQDDNMVQQNAKDMFSKMNNIDFLYKNYTKVMEMVRAKLDEKVDEVTTGTTTKVLDIDNFEKILVLQRQIKQQLHEFQKENGDDQKSITAYNQLLGLVQNKLESLDFDAGLAYMPDFISIGLDLQYVAKDIDKVVFQHWLFFKSHWPLTRLTSLEVIKTTIDKCTNLHKINQIELENADILKNYKSVNSLLSSIHRDMQVSEINKNMSAIMLVIIDICHMYQPQLIELKMFLKTREEDMRQFSNLTYDITWKKVLYRLCQLDIVNKQLKLKITDNQIMALIASDFDPGQVANFKEGVENIQKKIDQYNQFIKSIVFMDL